MVLITAFWGGASLLSAYAFGSCYGNFRKASAAPRSESLKISVPVPDAHTPADDRSARSTLDQYVRIPAKSVRDCTNDAKCSALAMKALPELSFVDHARSIDWLQRHAGRGRRVREPAGVQLRLQAVTPPSDASALINIQLPTKTTTRAIKYARFSALFGMSGSFHTNETKMRRIPYLRLDFRRLGHKL